MNRGRRPAIRHKDMRRMSLQARALRGTHAAAGPENASGLQATKGRAGTRRSVRLPGALGSAMGYGRQTRGESPSGAPCGGHVRLGREIPMKIQRAAEDYLEAMLIVKERCGYIRSVDVARQLGVTKPSVSCATKRLRENGLIVMDSGGYISLTKAGMEIAVRIYARHRLLTEFLTALGVDPQTAAEDACRLEHDLSEASFAAIRRHAARFGAGEKDGGA